MRQNGGRISHFRRAETTSFNRPNLVQIDVPRIFPKPFHEYATIKLRVKVVFYVTHLYATAGIRQCRLINVAPTPGCRTSLKGSVNFLKTVRQMHALSMCEQANPLQRGIGRRPKHSHKNGSLPEVVEERERGHTVINVRGALWASHDCSNKRLPD